MRDRENERVRHTYDREAVSRVRARGDRAYPVRHDATSDHAYCNVVAGQTIRKVPERMHMQLRKGDAENIYGNSGVERKAE